VSAPERRLSRLGWIAVAVLAVAAVPELARACAVCGAGREENRMAFLLTTLFLSVVPLLAIGGIVVWLRHRARVVALEAREADVAASPIPARSA
jgi:hypothetical protein